MAIFTHSRNPHRRRDRMQKFPNFSRHKFLTTRNVIVLLVTLSWMLECALNCTMVTKHILVEIDESQQLLSENLSGNQYRHSQCPYVCYAKEKLGTPHECRCHQTLPFSGARIKIYKMEKYNSSTCSIIQHDQKTSNRSHIVLPPR